MRSLYIENTTANNEGKFDARLTARAIDHSYVDQTSLQNDRRTIARRTIANRLSRDRHETRLVHERNRKLISILIRYNNHARYGIPLIHVTAFQEEIPVALLILLFTIIIIRVIIHGPESVRIAYGTQ